jgi:hypothetical protein
MKRNLKTILMGTVALLAGVGLASAQGMRDVPGAGDRGAATTSSDQMTPGASGSHREMNSTHGKAQKSETRGQAQRGKSDMGKSESQAKSDRPERSTTGQASSDKDELSKSPSSRTSKASKGKNADEMKSKSSANKKSEKSTTGQASKDKSEKSTTGQGSSEDKASSDSKQQMNRQSQDSNAAKQNQTTGSTTKSSTTEQSNASIRSQAGVQVSSQQRTTIQRSVLQARNVPRVDHVSFAIHTGIVVPRNVHIVSVSAFPILIETFPRYRDYSFFVVEDEVVFVDRGHKIVDVVPVGGGAHIGGASTSTTVAVDLSEPEIREVQTVLIREGFLHGHVTGVFDTRTREAVISFQRKRGFEANGRIDTRTVGALGLEGKVKVKSESSSSSSSSQSSTTGQGSSAAQKSDQKSTTGQGPSATQKNAAPEKGPSEPKGSNNAQPTPKDRQSSAPSRSTTGQGSSEKSMPGMKDHNSAGPSSSSGPGNAEPEKQRQ